MIRGFNGTTQETRQQVTLLPGVEQTLFWNVEIKNPDTPWVVVAVPDGDVEARKELFGTIVDLPEIQ